MSLPPKHPPSPRRLPCLCLAALLPLCSGHATLALAPAPPDAARPADEEASQPQSSPQPLRRVIEFGLQDDALLVRTGLPPTDGVTPINVPELHGSVRVDVTVRSRRDRPGGSLFFKLMHSSPAAPDGTGAARDTNVFVRPGFFQLNRVERDGDELRSTSLTQSGDFERARAPLDDRDDRVTLRARRVHLRTSDVAEDVTRTAPTFGELVRRYPQDAAKYLAPIFRDFGQEAAVFGADPRVAWQVLSPRLPRDAKLGAEVESLVSRLDAADYREREAASLRLRELGGGAALILSDLPRDRYSAEQNSRIDSALADYRPLPADAAAERLNDASFLLSCLAYGDEPAVRDAALTRLAELTGRPLPAAAPSDPAAREALVEQIRSTIKDPGGTAPPPKLR